MVRTVTLRKIPPDVARGLEERAGRGHTSLNRAVIGLLEEGLGLRSGNPRRSHHDLDRLAGAWSREAGKSFDRSLRAQRGIDREIWR
jgi:hypothetical protein